MKSNKINRLVVENENINVSSLDPRKFIIIKNAHQNNLKNLDLTIPHGKFVAITGVSGSGKSTLAFETLYEEGRRRYVESLSSYVRQFIGKIKKPLVDYIKGLPPAISIEQKRSTSNSRSTVGTVTEIYHYLKMFYARIGKIYSPISGKEVIRQSIDDIADFIVAQEPGTRIRILAPLIREHDREWDDEFQVLLQKGFSRILANNTESDVEDYLGSISKIQMKKLDKQDLFILIDRIILDKDDDDLLSRISDSVQTAAQEGNGRCRIQINENQIIGFSNLLEADGLIFEEPTPDLFSFNSPYGACPVCGGFGELLGIDEDKVVPNKQLSVYDGAVHCWEGEKMSKWKKDFLHFATRYNFPPFTPYANLTEEQKTLLWEGDSDVEGINAFFEMLESNSYKVHYRIMMSRFKGRTSCKTCKGSRLRKEANYVKVEGKGIGELLNMPISRLKMFFSDYTVKYPDNKIAERLLKEINLRLTLMVDIGLGYLTMNRTSRSLSGGETQRIQLIYSLGSNLTGSLYILDEPSIGLHTRDTHQLIKILKGLQDLGNTVVVVEHDEEIIRAADILIDLGPNAGTDGGSLIFYGSHEDVKKRGIGLTAKYLNGELIIPFRQKKEHFNEFISIKGAYKFNLKNIDIQFPVNAMTIITGVSGSGKTTLVKEVIWESFKLINDGALAEAVNCQSLEGPINRFSSIEFVSQDSIDRSRRSNAVTYLKAFDSIRELMASQALSKMNNYTPAFFSFNVEGGRCSECKGDGMITVEMQFVADMHLTCEECKGKRYKDEILEVYYKEKNIDDILNMTIREAIDFFKDHKSIVMGLEPLMKVGLDYLQLGQPTSTLSGGEGQRLKLASFLARGNKNQEPTLFIFDEPTTGLHWHDINKLLNSFNELLHIGHTLIVIEHNLEVIKNADYLIDLGKEGGEEGGYLVYQGITNGILQNVDSYTAEYLKEKI